jgi:EAL domain-containing protein (putative c-di-GMP-specific phosphodiesterase class I)
VELAERLRATVDEFPFAWGGHVFNVGVSIGHVSFGRGDMSLEEILGRADEACYMAKELGRNRVHSFQPGDEELARRHVEMEWVQLLREALREGRFVLYAQPIFDLRSTSAPSHVEILLRLRDESGALVPPMSFIPAAERYGLMPAIDRWVIATVCAAIGRRERAAPEGDHALYAINLCGGSLTDAQLPAYVRSQLREHGVPGHRLCFEITETSAIGNLVNAVSLIEDLKREGCMFSLDDFGSGMSSFTYLRRLPVNFLKIDGSFVRDIADDAVDRAMVSSINEIGHLMGLETIAEFVEDERTLAELRRIGVDHGQGYGLARPAPFDG